MVHHYDQIGVSPEFEMALYTLCFFCGEEKNIVQLGPYAVEVTCYRWPAHPRSGQRAYIATSFPGEAPLTKDEVKLLYRVCVRVDYIVFQCLSMLQF